MIRKRIALLIILLAVMIVFTGCWDAIEIDDRGFVMSLGVDKYEPPSPEEQGVDLEEDEGSGEDEGDAIAASAHTPDDTPKVPEDNPRNRFSFTYIIPNVEFIIGESENPNVFYNTVGENLYSASRIMTTRINKQVFFGHMKVLVIGETVARDPDFFREILDAIERDPFISRTISVAVAPGTAREVLEVEPLINPMTGDFIADLFRNKDRSPRSGGGIMGDILQDLHRWGNTYIPRVIPGEMDIKVAGSAVIKNYRLVGWLGEVETRAVEIIRGTARPGGLTVRHQGIEQEHIVPIDLVYLSTRFHLDENADNIRLFKEIRAEAELQQYYFDPKVDLMDPEIIKEIENEANKKLYKELEVTTEKLQQEFEVDILGIDHYLSRHHPGLWGEVKNEWQEIFPNIEIVYDVNVTLRRIGLTK